MIFEEKYISRYILLTDQIPLTDCLPVDEVVNFESNLNFLIEPFSYMTKKVSKKT